MATTVTDYLTALGIRLNKTIDANSTPTSTEVFQVIYEITGWILTQCVDLESELGRKTASISLVDGTADYDDLVDDLIATSEWGWLLKTYSRDRIELCTIEEAENYSPDSGAECEPDKFYLNENGVVTFLQTPDDTYTAKIPLWYRPARINATTYAISTATQADPCVITTSTAHDFYTGGRAYVSGIASMSELNGGWYTTTKASSTTLSLDGIDSTGYTVFAGGGTDGIISVALPFNGIFDHIYTEFASIRFQNIEEYKTQFEESWLSLLLAETRKVILRRKNTKVTVTR